MKKLPAVLVNYNYDPAWITDAPIEPLVIYDRSDDGVERNLTQYGPVFRTPNRGDVDYDKLTYLIENYDALPEVFLWSKSNLFKFIETHEWEKKCRNSVFTPLLSLKHRIYRDQYGEVNRYLGSAHGPIYAERADSWFFHARLDDSGRFRNWQDWCLTFGLPLEPYIPFAPGGSYILTREKVLRYSRDYYKALRETLPYAMHPLEAHCCERTYFYLWR